MALLAIWEHQVTFLPAEYLTVCDPQRRGDGGHSCQRDFKSQGTAAVDGRLRLLAETMCHVVSDDAEQWGAPVLRTLSLTGVHAVKAYAICES